MNTNERIARGLGLEVVGIGNLGHAPDCGTPEFEPEPLEWQPKQDWPMYVQNCTCEYGEAEEPRYFGHLRWCLEPVTDYEHSLDALLEPLGVLRERGWEWHVGACMYDERPGDYYAWCEFGSELKSTYRMVEQFGATPSEALALVVAEALEASK